MKILRHSMGICVSSNKKTLLWKDGKLISVPKEYPVIVSDVLVFRDVKEIMFYSIAVEDFVGRISLTQEVLDIAYLSDSLLVLYKEQVVRYSLIGECIETLSHATTCDAINVMGDYFMLSEVWESDISIWSVAPMKKLYESTVLETVTPSSIVQYKDTFYIGAGMCVYSWSPKNMQINILNEDIFFTNDIVVYNQKMFVTSAMIGDYAPSPILMYDFETQESRMIEETDDGCCSLHRDTLFLWNDTGYKDNQWIKGSDWVGIFHKDGTVETLWTDPGGSQKITWRAIFSLGDDYYMFWGTGNKVLLMRKSTKKVVHDCVLTGWLGLGASGEHFWLWNDSSIEQHNDKSLLTLLNNLEKR